MVAAGVFPASHAVQTAPQEVEQSCEGRAPGPDEWMMDDEVAPKDHLEVYSLHDEALAQKGVNDKVKVVRNKPLPRCPTCQGYHRLKPCPSTTVAANDIRLSRGTTKAWQCVEVRLHRSHLGHYL